MLAVKLDPARLLGFRLVVDGAVVEAKAAGVVLGAKLGAKLGGKVGKRLRVDPGK